MDVIYTNNDNVVEIAGLQNSATEAYLNSATCTFTLSETPGGSAVSGADGVSLTYVSSSDGVYRGTLADTVSLTNGKRYYMTITADAGADLKAVWTVPVVARERNF